ncbi:MAG: hypothetical protein ACK56I_06910, partial [bacterium]
MRASNDAGIRDSAELMNGMYNGASPANILFDPARVANPLYSSNLSLQEQLKVSGALLFQAVCE